MKFDYDRHVDLRELVPEIQSLYDQMGAQASGFQSSSGLTCLTGCGKCCLNPEVSATPLEMLPMAWKMATQLDFDNDLWERRMSEAPDHCMFYSFDAKDPARGQCSQYLTRPSICRLFGAMAVDSKDGTPRLSVCKLIKDAKQKEFQLADVSLAPRMADCARKLYALHPELDGVRLPINQAFKVMMDRVLLHLAYSQAQE